MGSVSHTPKAQIDLRFSYEGFGWKSYIKYRPAYPPSFFSRIYDRHFAARSSNQFNTAHDAGAGAGIVSEKLAEKFNRVIVSEPNVQYLKIAEQRLSSLAQPFPEGKFSYLAEGAEKSSVLDGSVDCLTICEAIHWTDMHATVTEAARQLKSGGTFCMIHYSPPQIVGNQKAHGLLEGIFSKYVREFMTDPKMTALHRAMRYQWNGYDSLGFDERTWEAGVERWLTNCGGRRDGIRLAVEVDVECDEDRVGKAEKRVLVEDDRDWMTEGCDLEWFQETVFNFSPTMEVQEWEWKEFEDALGGKGKKVTVTWPNVQIIATKK